MECSRRKPLVKSLNDFLTCKLCHGYLIDATALDDCLHTFCRACILRHFENGRTQTQCPVCPAIYKKKTCLHADPITQALVYKSVPSLYTKEMQRREDFYRSTGMRAGSSCSDDSVIDRERDMMHEPEEMISQCVGDRTQYLSADDSISLSLEYYQAHLDKTPLDKKPAVRPISSGETNNNSSDPLTTVVPSESSPSDSKCDSKTDNNSDSKSDKQRICDKRYLQCPAGVNMKHLQKFVRMKYGLTNDHRVDIIYKGEVLRNDFSLMDVAYSFSWEKKKPMRFFYRIFTPLKIRPIKIVNTPTPTGEKQLQIVPVTTSNHLAAKSPRSDQTSTAVKSPRVEVAPPVEPKEVRQAFYGREETESEQQDKEILLANLQLQSTSKALQQAEAKKLLQQQKLQQMPAKIVKECVYQYEQPDQEEIKRFAEKRDREWALQKKLEEETKPEKDSYFSSRDGYTSKKRKKSKHSKNESNGHKEKKRKIHADKIHAEITNNDKSDLKLKVKITSNGHKHKHHKIENLGELSHKEKLLQMRQVRHKPFSGSSGDERSQPAIPPLKVPKNYVNDPEEPQAKRKKEVLSGYSSPNNNNTPLESQPPATKPRIEPMIIKQLPSVNEQKVLPRPPHGLSSGKVARKEASIRPVPFDQHALTKQTFLKAAAAHADKYAKDQKVGQGKVDGGAKNPGPMSNKVLPIGSITTNNKTLDRKIASLQQRCTIEPKNPPNRTEPNKTDKSKVLAPQYPPGFTVSKIENGVKRKVEETEHQDKRPSLEITLIPPAVAQVKPVEAKPAVKRPPPGHIPLEKIKNSAGMKSGISIIKMPENNGVLDLSKSGKSPDRGASPKSEPINGLSSMVNRQIGNIAPRPMGSPNRATPETKSMQLSNLQMLSKVATEHPSLNKVNNLNKPRPQLPSLHKMPGLANTVRPPGLQRIPPKLTDIQKFRPMNPQIRSIRPHQNQNIRNIPNPSMVLNRNQGMHQNRPANPVVEKKVASPKTSPVTSSTTTGVQVPKEMPSMKTAVLEQQKVDAKEISV